MTGLETAHELKGRAAQPRRLSFGAAQPYQEEVHGHKAYEIS